MNLKVFFVCLLLFVTAKSYSQQIIVDTASTSKYLVSKTTENSSNTEESPTFSDRALSIGNAIFNRLKARFNLEEAAESLKAKKDRILNSQKKQEEEKEQKEGGG